MYSPIHSIALGICFIDTEHPVAVYEVLSEQNDRSQQAYREWKELWVAPEDMKSFLNRESWYFMLKKKLYPFHTNI